MTTDCSHTGNGTRGGASRLYWVGAGVAILIAAAVVRFCGALNDLWLDEILALKLAGQISSPLDIFTTFHSEVNHHLYTAYLYLIGPQSSSPVYRLPSLLAGVGAVAVSGLIGRRRSAAGAIFAMLLIGFSYVLVLYSSEARGYAAAVFFSLLSFYLLDSYLETKRWPYALLFSLSAVLGFISQLVFLNFYLAALVWSGYRLLKSPGGLKQAMLGLLSCHALPILFLAAFYFVDIRHTRGIGGPSSPSLIHGYGLALAWGLGTPASDIMEFFTCVLAVAGLVAGVRFLGRENSDLYVFFPGVILVFPILLIVMRGTDAIFVRYFIVGIAFLLILGSFVLTSLYHAGPRGKAICFVLMFLYLAANGWHIAILIQYGRGHYRDAIRFMAEESSESPATIGSPHDLRTATVLEFYGPAALGNKRLEYFPQGAWPRQGPEWIICHGDSCDAPTPPVTELTDEWGHRYEFVKAFPAAPLAGMSWFVYHNRLR